MQQWYQCPRCGAPVAFGCRFCTNCGTQLNWPTQQIQPPPVYQHPQQQWNYGYRQPGKEPKKTSSWLIGCLGLIAIVFLIGGAILVLREPSSTTQTGPEYIRQHENEQPPVKGTHGNTPYLSNNSGATDVSFAKLKSFIREDVTDEGLYLQGVRDCVDFAEQVHNNAERAGIKAAYVSVHFVGEEIGHALNAFKTTDSGLVYIDCTGMTLDLKLKSVIEGVKNKLQNDAVAYIEKDKQLGAISIDKAESSDYGFYVEYTQDWQKLNGMIDDFNNEVDAFNRALGGRTALAKPERLKFKAWQAKIEGKKQKILELADKLGDSRFKPMGIVKAVDIYW
jgi:hypothetical protein